MALTAFRKDDNTIVHEGDTLTDFRGDHAIFVIASRPTVPGKSGKVIVNSHGHDREYYASVFDLYVTPR